MILREKTKKEIEALIQNIENKSAVEIVAFVTKSSVDYKFLQLIISFCVTFFLSFILAFFIRNNFILLEVELFLLLLCFSTLYFFNKVFFAVLPANFFHQKASKFAREEFIKRGLQKTKNRTGMLFFVSIQEKYAEILVDKGISELIEDNYWENIILEFTKGVKQENFSVAYIKAMQACETIVIKKFPKKQNDINELPNEIIEME